MAPASKGEGQKRDRKVEMAVQEGLGPGRVVLLRDGGL